MQAQQQQKKIRLAESAKRNQRTKCKTISNIFYKYKFCNRTSFVLEMSETGKRLMQKTAVLLIDFQL